MEKAYGVGSAAGRGCLCYSFNQSFDKSCAEREFPINGNNVSELDTEMVVEKIAKAEGLENSSQLFVDADNFDLMFTSDFNWANDGAIRFLYGQNQKYYSAQLRMFHDDNKYFITDRSEWIEPEKIFLLSHYLVR